jgi:hypothetical protein
MDKENITSHLTTYFNYDININNNELLITKYDNTIKIKFKFNNSITYELIKYDKIKNLMTEYEMHKKIFDFIDKYKSIKPYNLTEFYTDLIDFIL